MPDNTPERPQNIIARIVDHLSQVKQGGALDHRLFRNVIEHDRSDVRQLAFHFPEHTEQDVLNALKDRSVLVTANALAYSPKVSDTTLQTS